MVHLFKVNLNLNKSVLNYTTSFRIKPKIEIDYVFTKIYLGVKSIEISC